MKKTLLSAIALALACAALPAAAQQTYPSKPLRFIVPWPPGGAADLIARMIGERLSPALGQPVIVENRPGAGGIIGTEAAAKSAPDGYTMLLGSTGPNAINMSLYSKLPYDPLKDLTPFTQLTALPLLLVAGPTLPVNSVKELLAYAKANPGKVSVASVGAGTAQHLAGEIFKSMGGVQWLHVAYKGSGPAFTDLLGGQVQMLFDNIPASMPHIKGGKVRVLAVTSATRSSALPEVPTVAEAGLPGYEAVAWQNLLVPAGTPRPILDRLNAEVVKIVRTPEVSERLVGLGAIVIASSVDEAGAHLRNEAEKWGRAVRAAGVKLD